MGIEYSIEFSFTDTHRVASLFAAIGALTVTLPTGARYDFQSAVSGRMPDGTAKITESGVIFYSHGGQGEEYLGKVIASLVREFGSVNVRKTQ